MTAVEIADELFNCGKQVKKCLLTQASKYFMVSSNEELLFDEYVQLLKQLQILYHSLGGEMENLNARIQAVMDLGGRLADKDSVRNFLYEYIDLCDNILINTIKFRRKYCIIRRNDRIPGIGSHVITNLGQILFSLDSGYIPVIDTVNVDNIFTEISKTYSANAWELYFRQPMSVGLEAVRQATEIRYLDGIPAFKPDDSMDCLLNPNIMDFWRRMIKKYMQLSLEMEACIERCIQILPFHDGVRIAGVLCRGTDYVNIRPHGHPVQPSVDYISSEIEQIMEEQKCDYCYLVTEDQDIADILKRRFGSRLLMTQQIFYPSDSSDILTSINNKRNINAHQKNKEYLTALAILAKCQVFIGGRTSGTVTSFLLSDGFEKIQLWNRGRYGIDDLYTLASHIS